MGPRQGKDAAMAGDWKKLWIIAAAASAVGAAIGFFFGLRGGG